MNSSKVLKKSTIKRTKDEKYMIRALKLADKAYQLGETPIGCVIVKDDKVLVQAYNRRNTDKNTLAHAEMLAIKKACKKLGDWRLEGCTMYVTLEPCPMCAGALVQSRIDRVVIGAMNPKAGFAGSLINLFDVEGLNHKVQIETGVMAEESSELMKSFFKELRANKKESKSIKEGGYKDKI
ncbi:MAG: tRNA adenosine(34) deaminase TadA [Lachnospiraceae bacterium]|nr:tRNA adenosine(34) deaminase TadA [Lachnospiraceae bacterium]